MWSRVESLLANAEVRARLAFWMWVVSLGVLLLGFGVVAWRILTR